MIIIRLFLFVSSFFFMTIRGDGFVADTLVRMPYGSIPIQKLSAGDEIVVCTFKNDLASESIANVISHDVDAFIRLEVDGDIIDLARDQLLFVPLQLQWLPASDISPGMYLLGAPLRAVQVRSVTKVEQKTPVHAISLNQYHNYLVGKQGIVAHNFSECALIAMPAAESITFLNAFLIANPLVAPVTIGVSGAGLVGYLVWTFVSEIKESRKAKRDKGKNGGGSGQPEEPKKPQDSQKDPQSVGAAAVALLKAIDDSKEKALEVFDKTCEYLSTGGGFARVSHAFRPGCGHNFGPLLARMGADINSTTEVGKKRVIEVGTKILMDICQKLIDMGTKLTVDTEGLFQNIVIDYGGELITVRGRIHEGIIKMGTMFIQPQHVRKLL